MDKEYILIARLNASSKVAFSELYDKYVDRVYAFVLSIIRDELAAEDITQTVFIQLWEHRKSISSEKNLAAWLYVTARNAVFKEMRRMFYMEKYVSSLELTHSNQEASDGVALDRSTIRNELALIVDKFPTSMRNIYTLRMDEGMSVADIAVALGISPKTVETQLLRAKIKIQEKMKKF